MYNCCAWVLACGLVNARPDHTSVPNAWAGLTPILCALLKQTTPVTGPPPARANLDQYSSIHTAYSTENVLRPKEGGESCQNIVCLHTAPIVTPDRDTLRASPVGTADIRRSSHHPDTQSPIRTAQPTTTPSHRTAPPYTVMYYPHIVIYIPCTPHPPSHPPSSISCCPPRPCLYVQCHQPR